MAPTHFQKAKAASTRMHKAAAFHEVKHNPPKVVKQTAKKEGPAAARKQSIAIALSKARKQR